MSPNGERKTDRIRSARRWRISVGLCALLTAFEAALAIRPAHALERVFFEIASQDPRLRSVVEQSSALAATVREGRSEPREILAAALADYRRLVEALYAQGHYSVVVSIRLDGREAADIPLLAETGPIERVVVRVDPGPPFRFGAVDFAPLPPGSSLPAMIAPGKAAPSGAVQEAVDAVVEGWRALGHAKARPAGERIVADHAAHLLDVAVRLDPGPLVRFGRLRQVTPSAVRPERIAAIAGLPEGEVFAPETVERVADRLRRTGAFSTVALAEDEALSAGNTMDMLLSVVDEKPRRIGLGAEISSLDGLEVTGFWLHRNLRGGAERFRLDARLSGIGGTEGIDKRLQARLDVPAVRPKAWGPDTRGFVHAEAEQLDEPDFTTLSLTFGAGLGRDFSDTLSAEAGIAFSWVRATDAFGDQTDTLAMLPAELVWDRRENRLDPARGQFLKLGATPFLSLGDGGAGLRATLDARVYHRLGQGGGKTEAGVVLAGRLQTGTLVGVTLSEARPDFLFHTGGGDTVRGQPYQSLGVDLGGGLRSGGLSFLTVSFEARVPLTQRLGAVGFVDAGHVGTTSLPGSAGAWHAGAGVGLRYRTPFGPIRLDLAVPVGGTTGSGLQAYLGIGQSF